MKIVKIEISLTLYGLYFLFYLLISYILLIIRVNSIHPLVNIPEFKFLQIDDIFVYLLIYL